MTLFLAALIAGFWSFVAQPSTFRRQRHLRRKEESEGSLLVVLLFNSERVVKNGHCD